MKDLFEQKIQTKHIRDIQYFRDFKGADNDYDAGPSFFCQYVLVQINVFTSIFSTILSYPYSQIFLISVCDVWFDSILIIIAALSK